MTIGKKIVSVFLSFLMLFSVCVEAFAGTSMETALNKVNLYVKEESKGQLLTWKGVIDARNFAPDVIVYKAEDGKEYPAFCANPNKGGVENFAAKNYDVDVDRLDKDPHVWGAITNGYPYKTPAELGVKNAYEAYYITKMAVWAIVHDNYSNLNDWKANGSQNNHVEKAMKALVAKGRANTAVYPTWLAVNPKSTTVSVDEKDSNYISQTYTLKSNVDIKSYRVVIDGNVPAGAKVTDVSNKEKTEFAGSEMTFKVLIPKDSPKGEFRVLVKGKLENKSVLFGVAHDEKKQNYYVSPLPSYNGDSWVQLAYAPEGGDVPDTPETPTATTDVQILKVRKGTKEGLAGAVFKVEIDGKTIGHYVTDKNGEIKIEKVTGTLSVTEEVPQQATFKTPLATATAETDLDIATVHPSTDNHRKTFNDTSLQELADSIREVGVLQAIAVRPRTEGGYEIIYGERRYRASLLAGAKTIKAAVYNNVTDDEAEDMSLSENLQREQVRPTEEARAFKRLLEKGRYDIYSLAGRFGRSEKYIYTRLKLNELYAPVGELLDNETITISVAEEISTYEPNIQKDVYEKHLKEGNGEDWTGYTLNLFKRYFEKYYTTDLEQYKFDKTECKACVHNAANYNLFAEHNGCGHCTNRKCLEAKNAAHVAKETEKLLKSDPKLVVARPYYGSRNDMALQKLDKKGHEIKELDYNVSAREFPKAPEAPKKERFTEPKEYEQAVETFERRNEEYARKVEELGRMKEEGRIKTYVRVGQTEPELCYVEIKRKETAPVTIGTLQERDKRFKQLSIEKTVADTKKIVRENDYPESPFTQYEDGMVYFAMLAQLQRRHFPLFGIKDQPFALDEKQRMKIVAKLTDAQKTVIKRDFISHFLCENGHGDNNASKLLRDFANMHFPDRYGLARATHEEEYQKRHERLEERIKEMKKAEKKAAKEAEKQQAAEKTEKKTTAPKTEKPESGKAA